MEVIPVIEVIPEYLRIFFHMSTGYFRSVGTIPANARPLQKAIENRCLLNTGKNFTGKYSEWWLSGARTRYFESIPINSGNAIEIPAMQPIAQSIGDIWNK